ncbi:hypothetical protein [Flavobacterium sp.]|uniref:hypothetical protein n=1 Tax=Flavobacterium sp. TaxID=239 RepID=UPI0025DD6EDC|nr:hypothetical protein [Flavobacterium sp.]
MKKIITICFAFVCVSATAQITVYESNLDKVKSLIKYDYLPFKNRLVVLEAFKRTSTVRPPFYNAISIDENGKSELVIDNEKFRYFNYSSKNDALKGIYQDGFDAKEGFVIENSKKQIIDNKDFINFNQYDNFFDDKYIVILTDDKGKGSINIEKKDIYLTKYDIAKKTMNTVALEKVDIQRLQTKDIKTPKRVSFRPIFNTDSNIEIITKSISKNNNSSVLYRTIYDLNGKKINDYAYKTTLTKGFLSYFATFSTTQNEINAPDNADTSVIPTKDLDFNEFYVDNKTNEVYVYGVEMNSKKDPIGFYINKFSREGNLIWEKFYPVDDDKKGFNDFKLLWKFSSIYLYEFMDDDNVVISISGEKGGMTDLYNHFFVIDKSSGKLVKRSFMSGDLRTRKMYAYGEDMNSVFAQIKIGTDRYCSRSTLIALGLNPKVDKYVRGVVKKGDVFFDSFITSKGVWLMESDDATYFKVTLFKE